MIATDQGIRYEQNLPGRQLALLVLSTNDWTRIRGAKRIVLQALTGISTGSYVKINPPRLTSNDPSPPSAAHYLGSGRGAAELAGVRLLLMGHVETRVTPNLRNLRRFFQQFGRGPRRTPSNTVVILSLCNH